MPRVEEEIVIDRPPEQFLAFVTTPENDKEWVSEPLDGRTRFRWILEADPGLGGLYLGKLTDPLVTLLFRRRVRGDLRRLKEVLERRERA